MITPGPSVSGQPTPDLCIDPLCYAAGSRHSHGVAPDPRTVALNEIGKALGWTPAAIWHPDGEGALKLAHAVSRLAAEWRADMERYRAVRAERDECCGNCGPGLCAVDARNGEQFTGRGVDLASSATFTARWEGVPVTRGRQSPSPDVTLTLDNSASTHEPPPSDEGAALIAATEQEIADALPADDATAAAESAAHAWQQTARILARALDGSPAAPVQPEERRPSMAQIAAAFSILPAGARQAVVASIENEQLRIQLDAVAAKGPAQQILDLAGALATAEREREALRLFRVEVAAALDWSDGESDETLLDSLRKNLRLRDAHAQTVNRLAAALAEVAEIADNLDKAEVGSVMTYGDARGIAATLRAALGSTPDTGSTA